MLIEPSSKTAPTRRHPPSTTNRWHAKEGCGCHARRINSMRGSMLYKLIFVSVFGAAVLGGCVQQSKAATDAQLRDAAIKALMDRRWSKDAIVIDSIEKHGDRWYVSAHHLPPTPGAHAEVVLSESGDLIEVIPGL